ncbi:MAG: type ISP restriction/modification enzyme [Armatimonadota bacterium]
MAKVETPKKLAERLADIARRVQDEHSDENAQAIVYGQFVKRWLPCEPVEGRFYPQISKLVGDVLDQSDLQQVFSTYLREGKDPAVYFYEDFLRAYDPANARTRGVHYSPPEVVSYMARVADSILRAEFGACLSEAVVLDPCCGTGTFLKHIEDHYKINAGQMIGLELMDTPAAITSCILSRCDIRQIDSLGEINLDTKDRPLVIIGNPPYSGHSSNAGKLEALLADYKTGLTERNPKWLQDDYVKFIRMAQHRVETAGRGIVAFITNHSYLFNPTFRAMRESLMKSFDHIYVLDLHGNAKMNQRTSPDPSFLRRGDLDLSPLRRGTTGGSQDENVFPIQMGVAISFMVRTSDAPECRVNYARIYGTRRDKLDKLAGMSFVDTPWADVGPAKPFCLFTPVDHKLREEYYGFPSLFDLFEKSSVGFVTSRDAFAVDTDRNALLDRIAALRDDKIAPDEIRSRYPVGDLNIESARQLLRNDPHWRDKAIEVAYRPFDRRWAYLSRAVMERPRLPFMDNLLRENVAIAVGRAGQVTGSREWDVVFCTDCPTDLNIFRRGGAMLFPRYIYVSDRDFINLKASAPHRDHLFDYIYAILHSAIYRQRYADFLAADYPRIPITQNADTFKSLSALGAKLISLHLLREVPQMTDDSAQMTIGGYTVTTQAAQTLAIRKEIDEVVAENPPWSAQ